MLEPYSPQISTESADDWSLNDLTETNDFPFLSAPTDQSIYAEISSLSVSSSETSTQEKIPHKKKPVHADALLPAADTPSTSK